MSVDRGDLVSEAGSEGKNALQCISLPAKPSRRVLQRGGPRLGVAGLLQRATYNSTCTLDGVSRNKPLQDVRSDACICMYVCMYVCMVRRLQDIECCSWDQADVLILCPGSVRPQRK
jgi:hypothetical protein